MDLSGDIYASSSGDASERDVDLHATLNVDGLNTQALLLLYLLPVCNQSDADAKTIGAVKILSEVQSRLSTHPGEEPFRKDALAGVCSALAAIRFGGG